MPIEERLMAKEVLMRSASGSRSSAFSIVEVVSMDVCFSWYS